MGDFVELLGGTGLDPSKMFPLADLCHSFHGSGKNSFFHLPPHDKKINQRESCRTPPKPRFLVGLVNFTCSRTWELKLLEPAAGLCDTAHPQPSSLAPAMIIITKLSYTCFSNACPMTHMIIRVSTDKWVWKFITHEGRAVTFSVKEFFLTYSVFPKPPFLLQE